MKRPVEPSADVVSTVGSTSNLTPKEPPGPIPGFSPVPPVKEATLVSLLVKVNSAAEKSKPLRA